MTKIVINLLNCISSILPLRTMLIIFYGMILLIINLFKEMGFSQTSSLWEFSLCRLLHTLSYFIKIIL